MSNQHKRESGRGGIADGVKTGLGILNAFREAVEESIQEAVDGGELSAERARETVQRAARRMQDSLDEARERLEFVPRREFETLRAEVAELRRRVAALDGGSEEPAAPEPRHVVLTDAEPGEPGAEELPEQERPTIIVEGE